LDKKVRRSALAGSWYEGSPDRLDSQITGLFDPVPRRVAGDVTALIEPHAGYVYSGLGAAAGYSLVQGRTYRRVMVLAPSHYSPFHGFSIAPATHFATPLGEVPLDLEPLETLRQSTLHRDVPSAHVQEHSIEIQLPLLQRALPGVPVVPLLIGRLDRKDYEHLAEELRPFAGPETLIVASSDFTHQGPRFDYQPFDADLRSNLRNLDFGAFASVVELDVEGFLGYVDETGITVCGFRPITLMLHLQAPGTQARLVSYYTSGDVTGDWDNSVSYLTAVFQRPDPHPPLQVHVLDAAARRVALRLAREAVERRARGLGPPPLPPDLPAALYGPGACFVTLQKGTELRGCIGRIDFSTPLLDSIVSNARSACSEDPRFPAVRPDELEGLHLEISVLTPPEPVASPEHIELGRHGVILEKWGRRGVFLPQVAVDQVWTVEETLDHLARKAGLAPGAWREDTRFEVFSCQVFSETDRESTPDPAPSEGAA
jgi:MEMO1 family protein